MMDMARETMNMFGKMWENSMEGWKSWSNSCEKAMDYFFEQVKTAQDSFFNMFRDWLNSYSKMVESFSKVLWPAKR